MKSSFSFFILILSFGNLFAQGYELVVPYRAHYFALQNQNLFAPQPSWSPVKVLYVDSVNNSGGIINYFNFNTWKDTANTFDPTCIYADGPSWTGKMISDQGNGFTLLFNYAGDTIFMKTNASLHDSFYFMPLPASGHIQAQLDSIVRMQVSGISDSVKCFSLSALDSSGALISNHPLNAMQIQLSKSNGFFQTLNFRDLPDNPFQLYRIDSVPMMTYADLYNFDIGDEFEYYSQCYSIFNSYPPNEWFIRILGKYFSVNMDTVFYHRYNVSRGLVPNPGGNPPYISQVTISEDTIAYPISNSVLFSGFPEENQYNADSSNIEMYTLRKDSSWHYGRPEYSTVNGFLGRFFPDSCIMFNHFEPVFYTRSYSPGLGLTYIESNEINIALQDCSQSLTYYKKGAEVNGTFVDLTSGLAENNLYPLISIYPNPVSDYLNIQNASNDEMQFNMSDITGRVLITDVFRGSYSCNMELLTSGIYMIRLEGPSFILTRKIIKK